MNIKWTLVPAVAAVIFSGCSTVNTVERAQPLGRPDVVADKRIVTDHTLGRKISILQVNEGLVSGNLKKIQVLLANNRSRMLNINYSFEWFDVDGMQVSATATAWKSLRLMGEEQKAISAIAPRPTAVDFVLKLQEPNRK